MMRSIAIQFVILATATFCNLNEVIEEQLEMLKLMKSYRIKMADAMRMLKKEVASSPAFGLTNKDAYNVLAANGRKNLGGADGNTLI